MARDRFDLVLMDIKMPGIGGLEAVRQIREAEGAGGRTPILALTANAHPADAVAYRLSGMDGVVEKPIKPERLLAAMKGALLVDRSLELDVAGVA